MASFITAGNATNGLQVSSDNTGILELKTGTGSGTTAVTFSTGQRATFPSTISVGNTTPATTGAGITFPAAQSASSDANTLDDYEEGTWTPAFGGFGSDPTVTYTSARQGKYTKIGNVVYVSARVALASASGGSGNLVVRGLPFTVANDNLFPACNLGFKTNWTTNGPDYGRFSANTTYIEIFKSNNTNETAITTANLANNTDFIFTGFYYV